MSKARKTVFSAQPHTRTLRSTEQNPALVRAEISAFRQKIAALVEKAPQKASLILTEWANDAETPAQKTAKKAGKAA